MGCNNSKNQIHVMSADQLKKMDEDKAKKQNGKLKKEASGLGVTEGSDGGSQTSDSERGNSASSKASHKTCDSGFNDDEYAHVITEKSDPSKINEVEDGFQEPLELDLGITGTACSQRMSAKERERLDEKRVMSALRDEGLIQRPMEQSGGGLRFDIVEQAPLEGCDPWTARRPPARLAKLERRTKKKKVLTEEEILAKLEKAEMKRKELEEARLNRITAIANKSDIQNAMEAYEEEQKAKEEHQKTKEEIALENREKKLRELREKLIAKQEHAKRVRERKQMAALNGDVGYDVTSESQNADEDMVN